MGVGGGRRRGLQRGQAPGQTVDGAKLQLRRSVGPSGLPSVGWPYRHRPHRLPRRSYRHRAVSAACLLGRTRKQVVQQLVLGPLRTSLCGHQTSSRRACLGMGTNVTIAQRISRGGQGCHIARSSAVALLPVTLQHDGRERVPRRTGSRA